ncbi:N-acetylneuraminate lyase [Dyadobacter sp. CECT 9275]|uniref:N-acetylneuraminate lyase n=1 Tax=Dyadobacter helix TaxID=2822344 RepID=A0A916N7V9_9BACT|nr:dihydrodipicolinate synthase family protein [Dyadobacter sp. CECT 9275]CAG5018605.1 N-acetylneuraminate lyase [Dyadobacter sp. CECT 9275]
MMRNKLEIGGLWPALLTPVDQEGAPQFAELEKIVQLCVDQKLDGLYILGSTGQGVLFTEKQRVEVTKKVIDVAQGKLPVIAQVGALNTRESVRLAQAAQEAGVYGISTVAPIYYQGGAQNALAHYRTISSAIDIPFFPYHVGNQSIFGGDARYYIDQILGLPNIGGMKLTTQNLYEISLMHILAGEDLILFSGADELFCQATLCGTVGAIGSFFNLWGEECQYVRKEFIGGNFELGNRFMLTFQEIINHVLPNIWTFFQKAMYMRHGVDIGIPNPPLGLGNKSWEENDVQEILDRIAAVSGIVNH